jgi:tRNA(Arg) A34 adenosine deaminase TadA
MVTLDEDNQKPPLTATPEELDHLLTCIEDEIVPLTQKGVAEGNKVFGAAILDKEGKTVLAQTNSEMTCPLFHGEVHTIYEWSKMTPPGERGAAAQSSTFLSTHEPCCMCISSIVWAGFTKCYFLFSYENTASQGIPHDINIMHELWGVDTYRKRSKFCSTACLVDLVDAVEDEDAKVSLKKRVDALVASYDDMSKQYHTEKSKNTDNSLAFG